MSKREMCRPILRAATIGSVLMLAGCVGGSADRDGRAARDGTEIPTTPAAASGPDVEAPEVFQARAEGLWDGRPSLGGIWVAHPDVDTPERVIIRNVETGSVTTGALFRREREIPGPVLQVSSDAAAELGMLAGAPATLDVTALRPAPAGDRPEGAPDDIADAPAEEVEGS
ncbi:hypothetical protein [Palleronia sp. LCG004]|uniref:hypothetical protein n=1 Tax=Palleronia sp. LCG004 TaxID=3079304 RepID=UPI002943F7ED|nr:hypothetical protein [Palleronia sp. LCG004]WOI55594.1 hypothetical protein RVY76_11155 [Palleronia sp. LCG004]